MITTSVTRNQVVAITASTFGHRLRAAAVPLETRKLLLGHANGDITTHYSAAELGELLAASERITERGIAQMPALTLIQRTDARVGKTSEISAGTGS